jgi:hypothetical protein
MAGKAAGEARVQPGKVASSTVYYSKEREREGGNEYVLRRPGNRTYGIRDAGYVLCITSRTRRKHIPDLVL